MATSWNGTVLCVAKSNWGPDSNNAEHTLPQPEILDEDLVERVREEEDLVATSMELLNEDALSQMLGGGAHIC